MAHIPIIAPQKGDLVKGHRVYAYFNKMPAIPGTVIGVSKSGHRVTVDFGIYKAFGLPTRDFTWRGSVSAYQDCKARTKKGNGLGLVQKRK